MQLTPLSLTLTTPTGEANIKFAFDLNSEVQAAMHAALDAGSFYEPETTMLVLNALRAGDRFIDVGGHIGYFSVVASKIVGPTGDVIAFEPAPTNYPVLLDHLTMNGCTNVLPLHLAAGPRSERVILHLNSDNDGGHALWDVRSHPHNERSRNNPQQYPVWMTTIASVAGTRPVRMMKLDVEGAEHGALLGAEPLLAGPNGIPFVIAEINRSGLVSLGTSEEQLRTYMDSLGYDTWLIRMEEPQLQKMEPNVTVEGNYVFNVLFWKRGTSFKN